MEAVDEAIYFRYISTLRRFSDVKAILQAGALIALLFERQMQILLIFIPFSVKLAAWQSSDRYLNRLS
ncbi:hypothetical protein [Endozoicomonas sp. ALB032]|uniref:hypothetical protein n=1 Tax=Endozoicomonas sp. ALB032 TaxID=3403082 RepID=UPI003BB7FBCB